MWCFLLVLAGAASGATLQYNFTAASNFQSWNVSGLSGPNPNLTVYVGESYVFSTSSPGHPLAIHTSPGTSSSLRFSSGVSSQPATPGSPLLWTVPDSSPSLLFYQCEFHSPMVGRINVLSRLDLCRSCAIDAVQGPNSPPCPPNEPRIAACTGDSECFSCLLALLGGSAPPFSPACLANPLLKPVFQCVVPPCPSCCPYEPFGLCPTTTTAANTTTTVTATTTTIIPTTTTTTASTSTTLPVTTTTTTTSPSTTPSSVVYDTAFLQQVLSHFGPCPGCVEDLDANGTVDLLDVVRVLDRWQQPRST